MTLFARLLIFVVCGTVGYFAAQAFTPPPISRHAETAGTIGETSRPPLKAAVEESALVAEWEQLRASQGGDTADLATLYAAVKDEKDPFRRRAFRAALIAEWSTRDPRAALTYLLEKDSGQAVHLMREWLRLDPDAAVTGILASGSKGRGQLRNLLSEIAKVSPGRLAEVASALPKSSNRWDTTTLDAFAIFGQKDPVAAKATAEAVTGPLRAQALGGIGRAWAEKDGPAALSWAQSLPAGEDRDAVLKAVLAGWAKTDPVAALEKIDLVPPGGEEMYHASDVGAQVLREAAKKDWDGTIRWLVDNPGKLGRTSLDGLQGALSQRLVADPTGTLRELSKSGLPALENVFANSILNEGYAQRDAVWAWLDREPPSSFTRAIRGSLLNAIAWKEPHAALEFLEKLPEDADNRQYLERGAQSMLNGGNQFHRIEDLLGKASEKMRPYLLDAAFGYSGQEFLGNDPQRWIARLDEVAAERRGQAVGGLAGSWAKTDPQAALQWAANLQDEGHRENALGSIAGTWAQNDPHEAAAWVDTLEPGKTRDNATVNLAHALSRSEPEAAWSWAMSIGNPGSRRNTLQQVFMQLRRKDPAIADQMLQDANLTPEETKILKSVPDQRGATFGAF